MSPSLSFTCKEPERFTSVQCGRNDKAQKVYDSPWITQEVRASFTADPVKRQLCPLTVTKIPRLPQGNLSVFSSPLAKAYSSACSPISVFQAYSVSIWAKRTADVQQICSQRDAVEQGGLGA